MEPSSSGSTRPAAGHRDAQEAGEGRAHLPGPLLLNALNKGQGEHLKERTQEVIHFMRQNKIKTSKEKKNEKTQDEPTKATKMIDFNLNFLSVAMSEQAVRQNICS